MVRVAYLLKKFPRLSETFILNEILAQERAGSSVVVLSRRRPDDEPRHPELAGLRASVEVFPSLRRMDPWSVLFGANDQDLIERVGRLVRQNQAHPHPRFPELLAEAVFAFHRLRELAVDHVHVHFATDAALVAMLVRQLGGPPFSVTAHAKDIYRETVDWGQFERVLDSAAFFVTVCDSNLAFIRERIPARLHDRVRRLYNGIDLQSFSLDGQSREPAHVLSVGRLVEKKGFPVQLEALALLRARGVPVRATWIGDGEDRESLEQEIEQRGLHDVVRLEGACNQDAVRKAMARATVFCLPCIVGDDGNRDALPTVLLEALAAGIPIVSTPVTGIPEILADGEAGLLVPQNDAAATADALEALLHDSALRDRLVARGRSHVRENFDLGRVAPVLARWFSVSRSVECESPA